MTANRAPGRARRRLRRPALPWAIVAAPALALVVAACSTAAGAPAYTYAPAVSPSPAAAGSPSASGMAMPPASAPATPASPAPAPSAPASVPPTASGDTAPAVTTLHIAAQNIQFDTDHLAAPAGQAWVLDFANNDAGIPHNVEILDAGGASVFKGQIVMGPTSVAYQVPALAAGRYTFVCDVHPTMTGTLTVA